MGWGVQNKITKFIFRISKNIYNKTRVGGHNSSILPFFLPQYTNTWTLELDTIRLKYACKTWLALLLLTSFRVRIWLVFVLACRTAHFYVFNWKILGDYCSFLATVLDKTNLDWIRNICSVNEDILLSFWQKKCNSEF